MSRAGSKRKFKGTELRLNVRKVADDELAAQQPHRKWLPEEHRLDPEASTPFGALKAKGLITENHYNAGQRYIDIKAKYRAVIGGPREGYSGTSKSNGCMGDALCGIGGHCECLEREKRYYWASAAVMDAGPRALWILETVLLNQYACLPDDFTILCRALDALVSHFGIDTRHGSR